MNGWLGQTVKNARRWSKRTLRRLVTHSRTLRRRLLLTVPATFRFGPRTGQVPTIVGMTVSTNYDDILRHVLENNRALLDHWIVVTTEGDLATRAVLENLDRVTVLFWDPHAGGSAFDKGAGLRLAQQWAYREFPGAWYLVLDSDVYLPPEFSDVRNLLPRLNPRTLYGARRVNYPTLQDFRERKGGIPYPTHNNVFGYFQLYALPVHYESFPNAGKVDHHFQKLFLTRAFVPDLTVLHLGVSGVHWSGRVKGVDHFNSD